MEDDNVVNEKKQYTSFVVTAVVALIIGGGVGFFVGTGFSFNSAPAVNNQTATSFPIPSDIRSLSGTVENVSGNTFVLTLDSGVFGQSLSKRTITVANNTKVFVQKGKDSKTFQKEVDAYMKQMNSNQGTDATIAPPTPFTQSASSMSAIVAGARVTVNANENIKNKKSFTASEVDIIVGMPPMSGSEAPVPASVQ